MHDISSSRSPGPGSSLEVVGRDRLPARDQDRLPVGLLDDAPALGAQGEGFDYVRLLWSVLKHRRLIMATTIASVVLAIVVTLLMTPIYRATATLQIDRDSISIVKVEGFEPPQTGEDRSFLQTQYQLLQSRSLAEHVMNKLGLMDDERFLPKQTTGLFSTLRNLVLPAEDATSGAEAVVRRRNAIINALSAGLGVRGVSTSKIVEVSFDHRDREIAQRVADAFARTFITDNLDRKYAASSYARKFLEERLEQLKTRLEENERELRKYAEENQIIRLDNEDSLISAKLAGMNENLTKATDERIRLEAIWHEAETSNGLNLTKVQENKVIQDSRIRRDELAAQYQEKLGLFKPNFPEMLQLKARITEFDRLIQQQIQNIKDTMRKDYLAAQSREDGLRADISDLEKHLNDQRNKSIQYNILKREVDTTKTLYEGLLQRYKEIGVAGGVGTNNISLIDAPTLPESPRSPRASINLAIGVLLGLLVGIGAALAIEQLDTRFKVPDEVEAVLGIPVLGIIPKTTGAGHEEALNNSRSAIAEAYRSLRTSIQFSTARGTPKSIYITSTKAGEGKSTTALLLSAKFSQLGLSVLLVDADMRKPSLHKKMTKPNETGLANFLIGSANLVDILQKSDIEGLDVITAGPIPPNPAELLASPKAQELLANTTKIYDLVVFDGPPLLGLADSVIMSSLTEASILVVAAHDGRKNAAVSALRRLIASRARVIGAVFTKFDSTRTAYGYGGYGYGEYYAYGEEGTPKLPKSDG